MNARRNSLSVLIAAAILASVGCAAKQETQIEPARSKVEKIETEQRGGTRYEIFITPATEPARCPETASPRS